MGFGLVFLFCFVMVSQVAYAGYSLYCLAEVEEYIELLILLCLPRKCWDYRCVPPHSAQSNRIHGGLARKVLFF